jgi:two-component system response regulator PilR (NtrC family)
MAQKETVLVIDDELSVADALKVILSDSGYQVAVAMSGAEALEKLGKRRFDLVITDVRLPDISGLDVLRHLRRSHPGVLAIIITAHHTPELAAESLSLGAVAVLLKPFSPSDLLTVIQIAFSGCSRLSFDPDH